MKKIFFIAVLALAVFAGCKKDDPEVEVPYLTVDKEIYDIGMYAGVQYINIESNTDWTISPYNFGVQGLDISPLSGSNDGSVRVEYSSGLSSSENAVVQVKWVQDGTTKIIEVGFHR